MSKKKTPPKFSPRYDTAWVVAYPLRNGVYVPCEGAALTRQKAIDDHITHSQEHWDTFKRAGYSAVKVRLVPIQ